MTSKHRVFPIVLALLLIAVSFMSPLRVSAAGYVDDLELVDYISEIVVDGDQALVSYDIPIEPFGSYRGVTPDGAVKFIGHGAIVNMSQDITTNTYRSFKTSVVLGTFTPVAFGLYYQYTASCEYSDDLKNITHMMYDGVLYEVFVALETNTYIVINAAGDNDSFRGCYFYKETNLALPNQVRVMFNDNEEHTIIFGTMVDVTEVVREYDAILGNIYPLGVEGSSYRVIDVSDLKSGASFDFSYTYDFLWQVTGTAGPLNTGFTAYFLDEDFALLSESCSNAYFTPELSDDRIHGTHTGTITVPEGAAYLYFDFSFPRVSVADCRIFQLLIKDLKITCATSALDANSKSIEVVQNRIDDMQEDISNIQDQMQGVQDSVNDLNQGIQDTNEKLDDLGDKQDQTNNKLDDILSGGEAGDELIAGGDKLEDTGAGLGEDLGAIQDFESIYMGQLEDNLDDIIAGSDLTMLVAPLSFVQGYLNKIVAGVPSQYMVVFTLPMLIGIFLYIVGHPVRAPRPDTSGDTVIRETFTETTVLSGPHAGRSTSTRTVTTSQEIGRVHNE